MQLEQCHHITVENNCDLFPVSNAEVSTIINIFSGLKYPKYMINKAHMKARKTFYSALQKTPFNEDKKIVSLPFSYSFNHLDNLLKDSNFKVVFKYPNTLGRKLISNRPKNDFVSGVYKIPCKGCNKVYFGETGRSFETRLNEHKRDVKNCNVNNAAFLHKINFNHNINWDEAKLLFKSNNYFTRRVVESSLINMYPNFNVSKGSFRFDKVFQNAILRSTGLLGVT